MMLLLVALLPSSPYVEHNSAPFGEFHRLDDAVIEDRRQDSTGTSSISG